MRYGTFATGFAFVFFLIIMELFCDWILTKRKMAKIYVHVVHYTTWYICYNNPSLHLCLILQRVGKFLLDA